MGGRWVVSHQQEKHACTNMHVRTSTHEHNHKYMQAHTQTHTHKRMHTNTQTYAHMHAHAQTNKQHSLLKVTFRCSTCAHTFQLHYYIFYPNLHPMQQLRKKEKKRYTNPYDAPQEMSFIIIITIIIMYSFTCYFSKLEHITHYKAKNQNIVKTNPIKCMGMHVHTHTHACTHTHTHVHTHTHTQSQQNSLNR